MSEIEDPTPAPPDAPAGANAEAAPQDDLALPADLAAESLGDYVRTSVSRIRAGESGVLPVVGGLLLISILFQSLNSNFLTAGNLVNLLVQSSFISMLAMAEVFVLLLGEIDLSVGFVGAIGAAITASAVGPHHQWNALLAIGVGLLACAGIGLLQGTIITRLGLPSFVVTLAGFLFWDGVLLKILGNGGTVPINSSVINDIAASNLTPTVGWIVMLVIVGLYGAMTWRRDRKRRSSGLVAPPTGVTFAKIGAALVFGAAIVVLCNTNRGILRPITGVPYVVLLVLVVVAAWSFLLGRTKFGRYVYAIGGNAEAARRAGIGVANVRTTAFVLCSFTAGIAGIVYESRLQSISTAYDGGTYVLYAVAAAVIGGTSLFGGHGKAVHGVLGGIVIGAIDNGMGLVGFTAASQDMVTALVLLVAVIIDAVARRGRVATV
jgi:D-xylose transport system permease protein